MSIFIRCSHVFIVVFLCSISAIAQDLHCDICGMKIAANSKNHLVLQGGAGSKEYHLCSVSCVRKARKYDPKLSEIKIVDFNRPETFIEGKKAFFLIESQKIKTELGEMAMPPFVVGFRSKNEAEVVQAKYGDGWVVEGVENAIKKSDKK